MAWEDACRKIPLDRQKEILEELGFQVPDAVVEQLEQWMENEIYRSCVEETPFCGLLRGLSFQEGEGKDGEPVGNVPQVYWFDVEAADVVGDYENILRGMESMAGGDLVFDQIQIDYSQVDWEEGRGEMPLTFTCNGQPCEILLKVLDDWLDVSMLDKLNAIIEALPGYTGRKIYGCSDMGQEVFLFYQDASWAQEFEEKTGIQLGP